MSKVLIVVDMQNDFISGALGTEEAAGIVSKVAAKIKNHEGIVLYTKDTHQSDYLSTQEGKFLPVVHCLEGTFGWELMKEIQSLADSVGSPVFTKDTFGSRDLVDHLIELDKKQKIESIELVGLCTDICIISNALTIKTFLPEVSIIVDAACCAGVTPEGHDNAICAMKVCQIEVQNE